RIDRLEELVRELSCQDDADRLVRLFNRRHDLLLRYDGLVTVGRRDLEPPSYRITRSWRWHDTVNPWAEPHLLPVYDRGILSELLYAGKPAVLHGLAVDVSDPAFEHFKGMRTLACAPAYERGRVEFLVVALRRDEEPFRADEVETLLLHANLLGRAATNLVLAQQLRDAYGRLDAEMAMVGRMQQHLLPAMLPAIEGLELGASYVTCSQAGGDYYDVVPLPEDLWGLFVADVSGHGVPAAVVMAMLHTLIHAFPGPAMPPVRVLAHLNRHLLTMAPEGMFATAFYGVYDPYRRTLRYANAGHPPPRVRRGRSHVCGVDPAAGLPLGIADEDTWPERETRLQPGDALLLYTDGIFEGTNPAREPFGTARLDEALRLGPTRATRLVEHVERTYKAFANGTLDMDDRTLLAAVAVP
ncbi:MAG TPA: PP2C family protein-serine/threonine phosphatase, partial [Gemmataceae bacterium]|nr:PP2C family protein-serine/threonine phosphatase [Gemmataceae bacterium]